LAAEPSDTEARLDECVHDLVAHARFLASIDDIGLPKPGVSRESVTPRAANPIPPAPVTPSVSPLPVRAPRTEGAAARALIEIRAQMGECVRCPLSRGRTQIVFGQGNPDAELMFVGEAPGADEDAKGLAFVGRAGQLLTDIIEKGMRLRRDDVFIANVIKCRPPGNRKPETGEILECQPFLEAQIRAIQPRVLVALGAVPGQWLAKSEAPIGKLRGRFTEWQGIPVMPTWHPAYLLRTPRAKKEVWEDMKLVLKALGRDSS
jgi:DNA polymerase